MVICYLTTGQTTSPQKRLWALRSEKQGAAVREWQRCNHDLPYYKRDLPCSIKYHYHLPGKPPVLSYSDDWRCWNFGDQRSGFTITYATVKVKKMFWFISPVRRWLLAIS
ncbi:uncharacterized protein [Typha angustifolia]|uniref:uncharacterized protein isoform X1 n=1 Tax=Typha angustifolia TaxID=59011 RepID=UPI003C2BAC41